jgi:hypothetical protein
MQAYGGVVHKPREDPTLSLFTSEVFAMNVVCSASIALPLVSAKACRTSSSAERGNHAQALAIRL